MRNPDSNSVIEARDLTKRFGPVTAVDRIGFDIAMRSITALLGAMA